MGGLKVRVEVDDPLEDVGETNQKKKRLGETNQKKKRWGERTWMILLSLIII